MSGPLLIVGAVGLCLGVATIVFRAPLDRVNEAAASKYLPYPRRGVAGDEHRADRLIRWAGAGAVLCAAAVITLLIAIV